jgi:hypothetical protein
MEGNRISGRCGRRLVDQRFLVSDAFALSLLDPGIGAAAVMSKGLPPSVPFVR